MEHSAIVTAKSAPKTLILHETTPAATKKQSPRARMFLTITLSIIILISGTGMYAFEFFHHTQSFFSQTKISPVYGMALQHVQSNTEYNRESMLLHGFMDAMLQKNWSTMWSMLAPDAQAEWTGFTDFATFEQAKFGKLQLQSYTVSTLQRASSWINPDTTVQYTDPILALVSLHMSDPSGYLSSASQQALQSSLFQNTIFALTHTAGVSQVLLAGPADIDAPILIPAHPLITSVHVPIMMYHHVALASAYTPGMTAYDKRLEASLTTLVPDFQHELNWLQQQGYHTINQTEMFNALYYQKVLPSNPIILTFDDGYQDVYTYALPALLGHHFRGVFYIITGMIGGRYMTWNEIRTLAQDGMQISSHTIHHVDVAAPPAGMTMHNEIATSRQILEQELGVPVQFFCYPSGAPFIHGTIAQQNAVIQELTRDGYVSATLDPTVIGAQTDSTASPYRLPRIRVNGGENVASFITILTLALHLS